jgi:hypothetical protein
MLRQIDRRLTLPTFSKLQDPFRSTCDHRSPTAIEQRSRHHLPHPLPSTSSRFPGEPPPCSHCPAHSTFFGHTLPVGRTALQSLVSPQGPCHRERPDAVTATRTLWRAGWHMPRGLFSATAPRPTSPSKPSTWAGIGLVLFMTFFLFPGFIYSFKISRKSSKFLKFA